MDQVSGTRTWHLQLGEETQQFNRTKSHEQEKILGLDKSTEAGVAGNIF